MNMATLKKVSPELQSFLIDFGLTDKEIALYLTLLKTGPNTIMNLARETGIKRSTTHNNVEELVKKGLVSQTNYGERRMVIAEDPEKLKFLVEQKKWNVKKLEESLGDVVQVINQLVPEGKRNSKVEVKYYEGEGGFREVCQRSVEHSEKEVLFLGNIEEWRKVYTEEYGREYYIPARLKKNLFLKQLAVSNTEGKKFKEKDAKLFRETRFLPDNVSIKPTIIISDTEVAIMISAEPYTSVVIEEKVVADAFKVMFNMLWESSK